MAVLNASDDAQDQLCGLTFDALTTPELLRVMERLDAGNAPHDRCAAR